MRRRFLLAAAALAALWGPGPAQALDSRYTDADGDMVADAPKDPKQFVDPSTLIFAYTPVEDPEVYRKVWDDFLAHMSKVTGKRVVFFPVQSNAAQIEAMRAGRLHVAGFNTGSTPLAVNCAGFVPFTMMASLKDEFGYEMEVITFPGSGIQKIEDVRGKKFAFTSETSNSGYKAPAALLRDEFKLSNQQYALILNAFMATYAIGMPLSGWVLDRLGVGRGLTLGVTWWSVAGMLTALAKGPLSLALCRALLAVGESGAWPSFAKAVAIWVPARWRTLAMGVCNSGSSLGAMIAPPLVVWITRWAGWQGAFIVTGTLGLLRVAAFLVFRHFHPQIRLTDRGQESASQPASWRSLLRHRQMWIVFVCRFLADPIWYFYVFWIPEFLTRERGLSLAAMGAVAWIPFLVSDIANFATGFVAQRLEHAGWSPNRTRKFMMIVGAGGAPVGVAAVYTQSLAWTMTFICIAIFFWMMWSVTVQTLPGDYFPAHAVGSVYGFGGMGSTLGSVVSIWLVGRTLDVTHSYTPVFTGLGMLAPVACLAGLLLMGRVERVDLDKERS